MEPTEPEAPARAHWLQSAFSSSTETDTFLGARASAGMESSRLIRQSPTRRYEVAADCTARFLMDNGVEVARVVIVDGGKEFYEFSETAGNAVYGVGKKIHTDDDDRDR